MTDIHEIEVVVDEANGRMLEEMTRRMAKMLAEAGMCQPACHCQKKIRIDESRGTIVGRLYEAALRAVWA